MGYITSQGSNLNTMLAIKPSASTVVGQIIRGATSQSADLIEFQDSSANVLSKVDASGNLTAASFIKTGGTSSQYLMADGSTSSGGSGGSSITYSTTAPSSPTAGQMWVDSNTGIEYTYVTDPNTSQWVELGPTGQTGPTGATGPSGGVFATTVSATAPTSPSQNDIWINTNTGIYYTYINDGTSSQWVEFSYGGIGIQGPTGPTSTTPGPRGQSTMPYARQGTLTVTNGVSRFYFPYSATILGVSAAINTPAVGANIIIDVKKNGTTIFTTQANRPTIIAGAYATASEVTNMDITSIASGDYVTIDINQVGTTTAGSDLTVFVRYQ